MRGAPALRQPSKQAAWDNLDADEEVMNTGRRHYPTISNLTDHHGATYKSSGSALDQGFTGSVRFVGISDSSVSSPRARYDRYSSIKDEENGLNASEISPTPAQRYPEWPPQEGRNQISLPLTPSIFFPFVHANAYSSLRSSSVSSLGIEQRQSESNKAQLAVNPADWSFWPKEVQSKSQHLPLMNCSQDVPRRYSFDGISWDASSMESYSSRLDGQLYPEALTVDMHGGAEVSTEDSEEYPSVEWSLQTPVAPTMDNDAIDDKFFRPDTASTRRQIVKMSQSELIVARPFFGSKEPKKDVAKTDVDADPLFGPRRVEHSESAEGRRMTEHMTDRLPFRKLSHTSQDLSLIETGYDIDAMEKEVEANVRAKFGLSSGSDPSKSDTSNSSAKKALRFHSSVESSKSPDTATEDSEDSFTTAYPPTARAAQPQKSYVRTATSITKDQIQSTFEVLPDVQSFDRRQSSSLRLSDEDEAVEKPDTIKPHSVLLPPPLLLTQKYGKPFVSRSIPKVFRLPNKDEFQHSGFLMRQKGNWKKKWARELFVLHHGVMMTCTKQSPFLVKLCIPLKNISSVDAYDKEDRNTLPPIKHAKGANDFIFHITYIEAAKKASSRHAVMAVMAASEVERRQWIQTMRTHIQKTFQSSQALMDLVDRDRASKTIGHLHDAMRNAGLYSVTARIYNLLCQAHQRMMMEACNQWRAVTGKLRLESEALRLEEERKESEKQINIIKDEILMKDKRSEYYRRVALGVARLERFYFGRLGRYLSSFQQRAAAASASQKMTDAKTTMTGAVVYHHTRAAIQVVYWRKALMSRSLSRVYFSTIRNAFEVLRASGSIVKARVMAKEAAMRALYDHACAMHKSFNLTFLHLWKDEAHRRGEITRLMRNFFIDQDRNCMTGLLRRWALNVFILRRRLVQGADRLLLLLDFHNRLRLSHGLRNLREWAAKLQTRQAFHISEEFSQAQDLFIQSYNEVPKDCGAYRLNLLIRKVEQRLKSDAFRTIQRNRLHLISNAILISGGCQRIENLIRRRLGQGLLRLLCTSLNKRLALSAQQAAVTQLAFSVRSLVRKRIVWSTSIWKRAVEIVHKDADTKLLMRAKRGAMTEFSEKVSLVVQRLVQQRYVWALSNLRLNRERNMLLNGIVRLHLLQRVTQISDRIRVGILARAFVRLQAYTEVYSTTYLLDSEAKAQRASMTLHGVANVMRDTGETLLDAKSTECTVKKSYELHAAAIAGLEVLEDELGSIVGSSTANCVESSSYRRGEPEARRSLDADDQEIIRDADSTWSIDKIERQRFPTSFGSAALASTTDAVAVTVARKNLRHRPLAFKQASHARTKTNRRCERQLGMANSLVKLANGVVVDGDVAYHSDPSTMSRSLAAITDNTAIKPPLDVTDDSSLASPELSLNHTAHRQENWSSKQSLDNSSNPYWAEDPIGEALGPAGTQMRYRVHPVGPASLKTPKLAASMEPRQITYKLERGYHTASRRQPVGQWQNASPSNMYDRSYNSLSSNDDRNSLETEEPSTPDGSFFFPLGGSMPSDLRLSDSSIICGRRALEQLASCWPTPSDIGLNGSDRHLQNLTSGNSSANSMYIRAPRESGTLTDTCYAPHFGACLPSDAEAQHRGYHGYLDCSHPVREFLSKERPSTAVFGTN